MFISGLFAGCRHDEGESKNSAGDGVGSPGSLSSTAKSTASTSSTSSRRHRHRRQLAEEDDSIGTIEETLKWGVPSYQTVSPKSGTPIRLQWLPSSDRYGIFVHCQTTLIKPFSEHHPELTYDKNRGILFEHNQVFPEAVIKNFLSKALRYRLRPYTA